MSVPFTVHGAGGAILRSGSAPSEAAALLQGGNVLLGQAGSDETQYVLDGALELRPAIADLDNVPAGTVVFVDGAEMLTVPEGDPVVAIAGDVPGTYRVRLEPPFPWRPYETDVAIP